MDKDNLTPAMKQFVFFKEKHPDCLILFRMGDFYEMFYDDAKLASKVLNITLTKRGTKNPVPLAGLPYHALDNYLAKLIRAGIKCAICEQIENPKFAKGVVKRDVVRVVTPGTIIDSGLISDKANNYLMSLYFSMNFANSNTSSSSKILNQSKETENVIGIAIVDLSTGEFLTTEVSEDKLMSEIHRISPAEIIFPSMQVNNKVITELKKQNFYLNEYEDRFYFHDIASKNLTEQFKTINLEGYGLEGRKLSIASAGALISYLQETQKTSLTHINKIRYFSTNEFMNLDKSTIRNLEIVSNIRDNTSNDTLLDVVDKTLTPMGSRLLKRWLLNPLLDIEEINQRLNAVDFLFRNILVRQELKEVLESVKDIERLISRVNYGNANARDLIALKESLRVIPELKRIFTEVDKTLLDEKYLKNKYLEKVSIVSDMKEIVGLIEAAIKDEPPLSVNDGGIIKQGHNKELDEYHDICRNGRGYIKDIEKREREKTGIKSLKVGFNRVFGYFIEITKSNLHLLPKNQDGSLVYIRKQTMANAERYITEELKQYEEKILGAEEKIKTLELKLFQEVCSTIIEQTIQIQDVSDFISEIDVFLSFANIASENNYCKPDVDYKFAMKLEECRHPVIEKIEKVYIPNDIFINNDNKMMIITGPNMSGKSTVMRQVALCVLMAQIGCFVPAKKAEIGIVDRIFTRVGAHDDLTHGQSTFMVEMNETATILNNATSKSLIIMDEIGRGTSTFDGVSIAWSVAEYINEKVKAKTMFATHYHVLTKLEKFEGVKNYHIAVKENKEELIFLRKLQEGGTDKSFGVHVAKLAGMPKHVIEKAREIQYKLEVADNMRDKIIVEKRRKNGNEKKNIINDKNEKTNSDSVDESKKENDKEDDVVEFTKLKQKRLIDL
ncbi:DNA mismatch repair protein MutS [Candidatus Woesearchaeota archaeon]|nr:DNA mismatch repair protein MutS [Candidatus Woesearchaeota archaeon]MBT5272174.1 DNA mismatch repair protein MutS [Candidatus Woesearchaeota archaeon]MBT6040501.1 DNA mismatch repair protein MutS [Candidatus Woesearchaeota archaeon]MBT6336880.1 DNA mismatch repair protein MutS [Candidatus Woesearchaeota archaeon]MBT7927750.1 DNA mismatch repair protein MutS [Candidatus Woesearchaeota archaeon]